jgi:hypothetical protein
MRQRGWKGRERRVRESGGLERGRLERVNGRGLERVGGREREGGVERE